MRRLDRSCELRCISVECRVDCVDNSPGATIDPLGTIGSSTSARFGCCRGARVELAAR